MLSSSRLGETSLQLVNSSLMLQDFDNVLSLLSAGLADYHCRNSVVLGQRLFLHVPLQMLFVSNIIGSVHLVEVVVSLDQLSLLSLHLVQ
jgi:hypothetical protein